MKILISHPHSVCGTFHKWMTLPDQQVEWIDFAYLQEKFGHQLAQRMTAKRIMDGQFDAFISYPPYDKIGDARQYNTCVIQWGYDDQYFKDYSTTADVRMSTSREACRQNPNFHYMPWAINEFPISLKKVKKYGVVIFGTSYPRRVRTIQALEKAGIEIHVWGDDGWKGQVKNWKMSVSRQEMLEIYYQSTVAIATSDWEDLPVPMMKLRSMEIASAECAQIVEESEELGDYFVRGVEVASYSTTEQLIEQIDYLLKYPEEAALLATRSYKTVTEKHNWATRWPQIMRLIEPPNRSVYVDYHTLLREVELQCAITNAPTETRLDLAKQQIAIDSDNYTYAANYAVASYENKSKDLAPFLRAIDLGRREFKTTVVSINDYGLVDPKYVQMFSFMLLLGKIPIGTPDELFVAAFKLVDQAGIIPNTPNLALIADLLLTLPTLMWSETQKENLDYFKSIAKFAETTDYKEFMKLRS